MNCLELRLCGNEISSTVQKFFLVILDFGWRDKAAKRVCSNDLEKMGA